MNKKANTITIFNYSFIIVFCIFTISPYVLILFSLFNTNVDIRRGDLFSNISFQSFIANWRSLVGTVEFFMAMLNSFIVSFFSMIFGVLIASMAGYAYVIHKNRITKILFDITFFCILVPMSAIIIPLFRLLQNINLLDNLLTVIILSLSLPFMTYLFKQNSKTFPIELIKIARVDGLNEISIFFKVYLPNMKSVVITAMTLLFIQSWNGFLMPLVIIQSQSNMTLPLFLNRFGANPGSDYGAFMLGLIVSTIPTLIIFVFFQKFFRMGMKQL